MKYLFQCAIGPVQDFIATARRSRDLWYGSWMLSELSKATAKALADKFGADNLVFPAPEDIDALEPDSDLNVANKIVAIVEGDPEAIGQEVHQAIILRLDKLRENAFEKVHGWFDETLAERQLRDLVEYYWVSVPFEVEKYDSTRTLADALLASRKNTRDFGQFLFGTNARKSSLDGARESVIPCLYKPGRGDSEQQRAEKNKKLYQQYGARRGERLSGVDLLKRHGKRSEIAEQKFKSTSHMAALPFLAMIDREKGDGQGDEILALLRDQGLDPQGEDRDGSLLFESRLREWAPNEETLAQARSAWNEHIENYAGKRRPDPYYALLRADGDNMGKTLDAQTDPKKHRELSQALSKFAITAKDIIAGHYGAPVYAGGDDILAYLPLHTVLKCAEALDQEFNEAIVRLDLGAISPTLSTGIVVAHHLDPLADALELSKKAEKIAKDVDGKHGLAITVSKRSGVERTIVDKQDALQQRMTTMINFTRGNAISKGVAFELQELDRVLERSSLPPEAFAEEAMRIVERKHESRGAKVIETDVKQEFDQWLKADSISVRELAQELIVAGVFAAACDLAKGPLAQSEQETTS